MAWANGWTQEDTGKIAQNWSDVGDMALNKKGAPGSSPMNPLTSTVAVVGVGSKHKFTRRGKDGTKLKNNKGDDLPPQDVEVVSFDAVAQTCTLKTKDGKDVVDIRTKVPVVVKFEWLE